MEHETGNIYTTPDLFSNRLIDHEVKLCKYETSPDTAQYHDCKYFNYARLRGHHGLVGFFVNNKFIGCQGSAVRISALPLSFISRKKNHKSTKGSRQEEIENVQERSRRSGEKKRKNRQANQERLRERLSVRFKDD